MVKNVNKNNALHAVLFEAVALATMLDLPDASLLSESCTTLGGALLRNFILGSHPS
jgi:AP-2 complex subunit alpha